MVSFQFLREIYLFLFKGKQEALIFFTFCAYEPLRYLPQKIKVTFYLDQIFFYASIFTHVCFDWK